MTATIRRQSIGYHYFVTIATRYGHRQIGPDAYAVMDDFGVLQLVDKNLLCPDQQ